MDKCFLAWISYYSPKLEVGRQAEDKLVVDRCGIDGTAAVQIGLHVGIAQFIFQDAG